MSYRVEFLDDETFEALPYRDMHEKIGVADPRTMRAFVRKSGMPVLDVFNAAHELEHLEDGHDGVHADHYDPEHQVYYKNWSNLLMAVAPIALSLAFPGIGSALGGALSGFGSALSGAGSSIAGALGSIPGIGGALGGAASSIGGALGSIGNAAGSALGVGGSRGATAAPGIGGSAGTNIGFDAGTKIGLDVGPKLGFDAGPNIGFDAGVGSATRGLGSMFGDTAKSAAQDFGKNSIMSLFGNQGSPYEMPSMGSFTPSFSGQGGPNMIAGASGSGSGGGPGGSPGSVGGGQVSKIRQELEQNNNSMNGGMQR